MTNKTLGQIAHDKGEEVCGWNRTWSNLPESQKAEWEQIAEAVRDERIAALDKLEAGYQARIGELTGAILMLIERGHHPSVIGKAVSALSTPDNQEALRRYVAGELRKILEHTGSYMLMNEIAVLWADVEDYADRYEKGEVK